MIARKSNAACLGAAIVSFTLAAGSVLAADQRPVFKAPPPPPIAVYDWTGFYVGGHVGWGWDSVGWVHTHEGETHTGSMAGNAFLGGVQAGFNFNSRGIGSSASKGKTAGRRSTASTRLLMTANLTQSRRI
jgi:opacity protein-like surface antigen